MTAQASHPSLTALALGTVFCAGLVWLGYQWPNAWTQASGVTPPGAAPIVEVLKLAAAAGIGLFVTSVHRPAPRHHKSSLPVAHAQILFCVAGALTIIIIGDSLARAFGAFGVASIVRFRTSLKDPEDATVLFLLIGLGMSVGRGILAVSGLGTLFVCGLLLALDRTRRIRSPSAGHDDQAPIVQAP